MTELRLSAIHVYPLKSAAGISQTAWEVDSFGLRLDRRWMVVDQDGDFLSQREHPRLALLAPEIVDDGLVLRAPDRPPLAVTAADRVDPMIVTVWGGETEARAVSAAADAWLSSFLGIVCRLVNMPDDVVRPVRRDYAFDGERTSFTDGFPFLLISEGSLAELNRRLANPVPMNRFRPNLVV